MVFKDADEVRAENPVLQVVLTDPDCELTVAFRKDYQVVFGPSDIEPDVTLVMPGDIADEFWKTLINKLVPLAEPLFPIYREKVAKKDAEVRRRMIVTVKAAGTLVAHAIWITASLRPREPTCPPAQANHCARTT